MLDYLHSIIKYLAGKECFDISENGRRIASVLTIMCCFHGMISRRVKIDQIPLEAVSDMLLMLRLMPQLNKNKCNDLDHLSHLISNKNFMKVVCHSILDFIVHLSHSQYLKQPQWLYSVPLLHLLNGKVKPFQKIELNPSEIPWKDREIGLSKIRSETYGLSFSG